MTKDFIPHAIAFLRAWLLNFKTNLTPGVGADVGLSGVQTTAAQDKAQEGIDFIDAVEAADSAKKAAVKNLHDWQKTNGTGIAVLRMLANNIKGNAGATPFILSLLRLVGIHVTIDFTTYKPTGTGTSHVGYVLIIFEKLGVDLMSIDYRIAGTSTWIHLGNLRESPYHHPYVLAVGQTSVLLEYRLNGVEHDINIGIPSDVITVTYAG